MAGMKWQEPPDKPAKGQKYAEEAAHLRAHPGKWAVVDSFPADPGGSSTARSAANEIKTGGYTQFRPAGAFAAKTVTEEGPGGGRVTNVYAVFGPFTDWSEEQLLSWIRTGKPLTGLTTPGHLKDDPQERYARV